MTQHGRELRPRARDMLERLRQPITFKRHAPVDPAEELAGLPVDAGIAAGPAPAADDSQDIANVAEAVVESRRSVRDSGPRRPARSARAGKGGTLVGLDIEPGLIVAAKSHINGGLVVEHAGFSPIGADVVRDGEVNDVPSLATALAELFKESRLDRRVRIGIANQRILMRRIELPPLKDQAEIQQAVQFQAQDEIPMPLDTVVLDYHTLGIVQREGGPRLQVLLVAARRDMVERVLQAARLAGLQPEGVDLAAFGMIRALHPPDAGQDERVLYLAVGGLTNLAISRGLICEFTRVIPAGVEQIAADVASRCAIDIDEARRLLVTPASVDPPAGAAHASHRPSEIAASHDAAASAINPAAIVRNAIDEGVRRIGSEVRNSIDFYLTAQDAQAVGRAVLTGTALEIPGFIEALSGAIGITIERGEVAAAPGAGVPASLLPVAAGLSLSEGRQ